MARMMVGAALGLIVSLAGCGGGSGATSSAPGPVATTTPTPVAITPATGTIKPTPTSVVVASVQLLTVDSTTKMTSARSVMAPPTTLAIGFDTTLQAFTLQNELRTRVFGAAEFEGEVNLPDYFSRVTYQRRGSDGDDFLVIFKQPNANPVIPITYSAQGAWQHNMPVASGTAVRLDYFVYGAPTPDSAMPKTGTVTYRLAGTANYAEDKQLFFANSAGTLQVDFAAGTAHLQTGLTGTDFFAGNFGGLIGFTADGKITGSRAAGPLILTFPTYSGSFQVQFYGPQAEEVGFVYAGAGERSTFNGSVVGTRL